MNLKIMIAAIVGLGLVGGVCRAQVDAVTRARYDLKLGFTVGGKVAKIHVKPGDMVQKGDVLMELADEEGKALVKLYRIRSSSDLALRSAEAALQLARVELEATQKAESAVSKIELERAEIRTTQAGLEVRMAKQTAQEALHQLAQAQSRHEQYLLLAPTGGAVDLIAVEEGELVESLKAVLRLVVIDPLWIDAAVPTEQTLGLKRGDPAWVQSQLGGYDKPVRGTIVHLAQVADAASDTRLVRVEIANPKQIPAGGQVIVSIHAPTDTTSTAVGSQTLHDEVR